MQTHTYLWQNTGTGTGTTTIGATSGIGSNVTGVTENSATSALTVSGGLTVNSSGTTLINSSNAKLFTLNGGISGTGNLVIDNNGSLANGITISATTLNNTGSITNSGSGTGNELISAVIGANVTSVAQNSPSLLKLSGVNLYTGFTAIVSGTIQLGNAAAISTASDVFDDGVLDINGFSPTINGLSGTGTVDNVAGGGSQTVTVGGNNATSSFSGVIQNTSGSIALTKIGSGTLTLSGADTYTGGTTIKEERLSPTLLQTMHLVQAISHLAIHQEAIMRAS